MKILICPYCGDEKNQDEISCCGESSAHFEWIESEIVDEEPEQYPVGEAEKTMRHAGYGN